MGALTFCRSRSARALLGMIALIFMLSVQVSQAQVTQSPLPAFHLTHALNARTACPDMVPPFLHWAVRDLPNCELELELNPTLPGGTINPPTAIQIRTVVEAAINTWNAVDPSHITLKLKAGNSTCSGFNGGDGVNCIFFEVFPPAIRKKPARTAPFPDPATGRIGNVDMKLNAIPHDEMDNPQAWTVNPNCGGAGPAPKYPVGLQNVVLHELGHVIGLDHPNVTGYAACPQHDQNNLTVMYSQYTDPCELSLHQADEDGANYLYSYDLGDAKDTPYVTKVHNGRDGPAHLFGIHTDGAAGGPRYQYEWLALGNGKIDDNAGECEALQPDGDAFDDGVSFTAVCDEDDTLEPLVKVKVGVKTAMDVLGKGHDYAGKPMYVNGWFDWNDDGDFDDVVDGKDEHAIKSATIPGAAVYPFNVSAPDDAPCKIQTRFRLDWNEDAGNAAGAVDHSLFFDKGSAQHGEVEDHIMEGKPEGSGSGTGTGTGTGDPTWDPPSYCHTAAIRLTTGTVVLVDLGLPCHKPQVFPGNVLVPVPDQFPVAGEECFETAATTGLDFDLDGEMDETIGLIGPTCVSRSEPYEGDDGLRVIDTEMTVFELSGFSPTLGPVTLRAVEGKAIVGRITQSEAALDAGYDVGPEFPANSTFEVIFEVAGDFGVTDPAGPMTVTAQLPAVPPVPVEDTLPIPSDVKPLEIDPDGGDGK